MLLPLSIFGQNTIGLPDIINYNKQVYAAGLQNWDITQDTNGIIYFANNEGLLSFDGKYWNLFPLPNKTIVRSVKIGNDNNIYVGGQDELGYFSPSKSGVLEYHSLNEFIRPIDKAFGDVWDIVCLNKEVFFRTFDKIFKFSNNIVTVFKAPTEWTFLENCNNQLYAHDFFVGLMKFDNNSWQPLEANNTLPKNDPITSLLPLQNDSILITTLKNGLFLATRLGIIKKNVQNEAIFKTQRIYSALKINNNCFALATTNGGVHIIDLDGNIIQKFTKTEGLQNNNALSIFLDKQLNLWLGLDNGIAVVAYNSAIKHINPLAKDESGYTTTIHNNYLYAGTSSGLYCVSLENTIDYSFSKGSFIPVSNANGQIWNLTVINNQLIAGLHEGAYSITNNYAQPIANNTGYWNFLPTSNIFPTPQVISGTYKGISLLNYTNNKFVSATDIKGFTESSRFVAIDRDNTIWVSHPYHGVYKLIPTANNSYEVKIFTAANGLPSTLNNHVFKVKDEVVVATEKGIYTYANGKNIFEPSSFYNKLLGNQSIRYLKEDNGGNIWFIHNKSLGVIDFSAKEPSVIYLPELNNKMLSGFELIYPVNNSNIFLGSEKGFFHLNYEKYKKNIPKLHVQIRSVRILNQKDSLLFGGYHTPVNEIQNQNSKLVPSINSKWKAIRFEFSSALFGYQTDLEFSHRLVGFNNAWSEWSGRTDKEFTNLSDGKYTLEVKVRNNLGNESEPTTFTFIILPPWYFSLVAKIIYFLLFLLFNYLLYRYLKNKFKIQQEKYIKKQKKLMYVLELERAKSESDLVTLRNENLEADINFKNSELASSAMHLVKKGELIAKLKAELTHLMKGVENTQINSEIKKLIKAVSEDDNMDKEWESFSKHFDKVHSDFSVELKEKHPTVTPNELKLCAYLRMNLSTKEIAQLMNISVRGVEISRYRLRKKLAISSETNLFDYLINLQQKK